MALKDALRRVSLDPEHFRSGRPFLIAQGVILLALGLAALLFTTTDASSPRGAELLGLRIVVSQAVVLVVWGAAVLVCAIRRSSAVWYSAVATVVSLGLTMVSAVAAVHSDPGPLGFDLRDTLLYGFLGAYNLTLLVWLNADHIEGPAWVPRQESSDREDS
ncbi:DUF4383 domain-containing protein [Mycolicibacterium sp. 3033]|nr:DUF4383 domain-containing protein [Mycolicibacterium aurantiacum]